MPRPRKCRRIGQYPKQRFFKPEGIPLHEMLGVNLPVEGLEALRLADALGLSHERAAELMRVSRPTFSRILTESRRIVARALASGWAIHIEGGNFEIAPETYAAPGPGRNGRREAAAAPVSDSDGDNTGL